MLGVPRSGLDKRTLTLPALQAGSPRARPLSLVCSRLPSVRAHSWWPLSSSAYEDTRLGSPPECSHFTFITSVKDHRPNSPIQRSWGVKASTGESGAVWDTVQSIMGEGSGCVSAAGSLIIQDELFHSFRCEGLFLISSGVYFTASSRSFLLC